MIGLGTVINAGAIILAGIFGMLFGGILKEEVQKTLMAATGLCVLFIGIGGTLKEMLSISEGELSSGGSMMMIGCFAAGGLIGEWIDIERRMEQFGSWLKVKTKSEGDSYFIEGFVTASLTVCIGAMAVVGAIQDGISGDYSLLAAKAVLDFIIIFIMTSSLGKGCLFAAIPVALFQGSVTLLARLIEPLLTERALSNLSLTGSMLIFCVGVNLIWGKKIKVANMLPTMAFAVAWAFLPI
ncbi:MAG: DUF554 domain-containing protein [Lachnospiraceae bacterium]